MTSSFEQDVIKKWGDLGKEWLTVLPQRIEMLKNKWLLQDVKPFLGLTSHCLLTAVRQSDNRNVIMKLGVKKQDVAQEATALKFFSGKGAVLIFKYDEENDAMLLEQVMPGNELKEHFPFDDAAATLHVINVIKNLHAQPHTLPADLPKIEVWLSALQKVYPPSIPQKHLSKATILSADLVRSQAGVVVLHGDLHHENILMSDRNRYLAVDPKGIIGEPAYEVGAYIRNPMPLLLDHPLLINLISHRLTLFSRQLGIDKQRLKSWSYVQAVLSACWAIEDGTDPQPWLKCAESIELVVD